MVSESNYAAMKFKEKVEFIDLEARCFPSNKITMSMIKCIYRHNHYEVQDSLINSNRVTSEYLQYDEEKTLEHIV